MSTYVIGDVHGCHDELKRLLDVIKFNPYFDKLIFVGDLIGRGPNSLEVLEFIIKLDDVAINVLGNHDLKLLAIAHNVYKGEIPPELKFILESANSNQIVSWLSSAPLIYIEDKQNFIVSHAGLPPTWDLLNDTKRYIGIFEEYKLTHGLFKTLEIIFSEESLNWHNHMTTEEIVRYTVFGLTRVKYCYSDGRFDTQFQCAPGKQPPYLTPWFKVRNEQLNNHYMHIFGHWAALGLYQDDCVICCDTGCVWGNQLTAINICSENRVYQVNSNFNASIFLH